MTDAAVTLASIKSIAAARVELCDMYIRRNNRSLRSQQWVVVSTLWNRRLVHQMTHEGQPVMAISPREMPTCYNRKDAERLVNEINAGGTETVKLVHDTDWWKIEKAEAERVLDSIPAN